MVDPLNLPALTIRNLKIPVPIIQGGLGAGISTSKLASAVSNEKGLGMIASVGLGVIYGIERNESRREIYRNFAEKNAEALKEEINKTRELTKQPFGVNIMSVLSDYETLARVCEEEKVPVIISGAGLPLLLPQYVTNEETKLIPLVSSGRVANILLKRWDHQYKRTADAIVVEGPLSGGHQGFKFEEVTSAKKEDLEGLLSGALEAVKPFEQKYGHKIPVIAAGGIYNGKDIAHYLNLGASGVQMGERFIPTEECDISIDLKKAHLGVREGDIDVIWSPIGLPVRVIKNEFYHRIKRGETFDFACDFNCLSVCKADKAMFCIADALIKARAGDMRNGLVLCSTSAPKNNRIYAVKELMTELVTEASGYVGGH